MFVYTSIYVITIMLHIITVMLQPLGGSSLSLSIPQQFVLSQLLEKVNTVPEGNLISVINEKHVPQKRNIF